MPNVSRELEQRSKLKLVQVLRSTLQELKQVTITHMLKLESMERKLSQDITPREVST
jgi:hypothetical protein